ncbi:GntR family transcriptional regulator [Micromonospora fiedleri]|uniref:GntR family transcriptional regulator n=1 Tax=Micromonospora fiedleri TaxID=1157498 RepID=A0ABS1UHP2_9ACTN|nr:GntR family transcriptional regulator [Micromonospora fiedleri]MBL6275863.1 GntR family transcriptional regulator [Micromonospora fiedleri]
MPTPHYGQPRYRTIADELRNRIESGEIPPGSLLPAESALTVEFRVARGTVRKAITALRDEGYAATEHGRGTYATSPARINARDSGDRQQKVQADARLAALFRVDIGTDLIEHQTVIKQGEQVNTVIITYRLQPSDP